MKHPSNHAERLRLKKLKDEKKSSAQADKAGRVWRKRTREQVKEKEAHDQLIRAAQLRAEEQFE